MIGSLAIFMCPAAVGQLQANALGGGPPPGTNFAAVASTTSDDVMGAAVMVAIMGLCSLVFAFTRATAVRRTFATSRHKVDADLTLLQLVAARQRTRVLALAALCTFVGVMVARLPVEIETRLFLEVTPALMLGVALVGLWRVQPLLGLRPGHSNVRVSSHGQFLYASRNGSLIGWVAAPPKLVARATSLPAAVAFVHARH